MQEEIYAGSANVVRGHWIDLRTMNRVFISNFKKSPFLQTIYKMRNIAVRVMKVN